MAPSIDEQSNIWWFRFFRAVCGMQVVSQEMRRLRRTTSVGGTITIEEGVSQSETSLHFLFVFDRGLIAGCHVLCQGYLSRLFQESPEGQAITRECEQQVSERTPVYVANGLSCAFREGLYSDAVGMSVGR